MWQLPVIPSGIEASITTNPLNFHLLTICQFRFFLMKSYDPCLNLFLKQLTQPARVSRAQIGLAVLIEAALSPASSRSSGPTVGTCALAVTF